MYRVGLEPTALKLQVVVISPANDRKLPHKVTRTNLADPTFGHVCTDMLPHMLP
jgi:hypothetical protein